ncbi:S-Ena type endospore appendage [Bacillus sp. SM2101]|uniref:S-Ena type endospore appendage n=1 Tax=Bacillus sp. SM2101 TaxID=2805366 RepID=UPI001BDDD62D|nr:S-Ena type endospore appendage [Bacillus sp. SM2101]
MNDIQIEPEVTIFKSVLGRGRNGLISIENLNGNSNNIEVTFVSFSGVASDPILIPQKTARTFSFENVKEIIVNNLGNSIASIEYEICVILDNNLLCLQGEDGSPAYSTNNIPGGDERTLYTSVINKGETGMISVEGDRSGGNMIEVSLLTESNIPDTFIILPLNSVTLSFEDIKEIKVKNLGGVDADIAHEICIILDKEIICSQTAPDGFISIPPNTEFSIFKSVSEKGERGMLGVEYETTDGDLIITFITVTGLSINPFILPNDGSVSLSFENIKEIKVNNINDSTPEICFELCRVIKH